jgi:hypothetical protein
MIAPNRRNLGLLDQKNAGFYALTPLQVPGHDPSLQSGLSLRVTGPQQRKR